MGRTRTDEFRQDAVRIALTSGLTRKQVASVFEASSIFFRKQTLLATAPEVSISEV